MLKTAQHVNSCLALLVLHVTLICDSVGEYFFRCTKQRFASNVQYVIIHSIEVAQPFIVFPKAFCCTLKAPYGVLWRRCRQPHLFDAL